MAVGGGYRFPFGHVKMVNALHGSSLHFDDEQRIVYLGPATGYVLTLGDKVIYHAGDTALFSDMKLIALSRPVDLALLPIGDNYTMGPEDALLAAEWVQAKQVIPMHYNTFPLIEQNAHAFAAALENKGIRGTVLAVGESITL
jgi:L-ascorbate metabolism protein UlaG (beta-lactamase superfamily)